jgi:hypothetical protein
MQEWLIMNTLYLIVLKLLTSLGLIQNAYLFNQFGMKMMTDYVMVASKLSMIIYNKKLKKKLDIDEKYVLGAIPPKRIQLILLKQIVP